MSNRPGANKSGGAARVVAPIALAVFAIACFSVLSSSGDDTKTSGAKSGKSAASATKQSSGSNTTTVVTTKKTYTVKAGDSFAAIAEKLNIDVDRLKALNPDVDPLALQPGEKLKLR